MKAVCILLIAVILVGCGPSAEATKAQTQAATPTSTPTKTRTPVPTYTPDSTLPPTQAASCGNDQDVDISHGSYDCEEYISIDENFACRLNEIPILGSTKPGYKIVTDYSIESGWNGGGMYAQTFSNDLFFIQYFSHSNFTEDIQKLLEDPATAEQGIERLELILDELLLPARTSLISVKYKSYYEDKGLVVALLHKEIETDYTVYTTEVTVISPRTDYFYFITVKNVFFLSDPNTDPDSISFDLSFALLPYLYNSCEFRR